MGFPTVLLAFLCGPHKSHKLEFDYQLVKTELPNVIWKRFHNLLLQLNCTDGKVSKFNQYHDLLETGLIWREFRITGRAFQQQKSGKARALLNR